MIVEKIERYFRTDVDFLNSLGVDHITHTDFECGVTLAKKVCLVSIPNWSGERNGQCVAFQMMRLQWIAAHGPMPVGFDAALATRIMKIAYYFLFNFGKNLGHFHRVEHNLLQNFRSDLRTLESAWRGVHEWQ